MRGQVHADIACGSACRDAGNRNLAADAVAGVVSDIDEVRHHAGTTLHLTADVDVAAVGADARHTRAADNGDSAIDITGVGDDTSDVDIACADGDTLDLVQRDATIGGCHLEVATIGVDGRVRVKGDAAGRTGRHGHTELVTGRCSNGLCGVNDYVAIGRERQIGDLVVSGAVHYDIRIQCDVAVTTSASTGGNDGNICAIAKRRVDVVNTDLRRCRRAIVRIVGRGAGSHVSATGNDCQILRVQKPGTCGAFGSFRHNSCRRCDLQVLLA